MHRVALVYTSPWWVCGEFGVAADLTGWMARDMNVKLASQSVKP
ncbi:hypothetical protein E2C01_073751 [Portunus trituberculatus]|uniref:Uncharacterized protein n=1 Tax=Portunus trituberculatus TaxID=210409 RepID=A0A5B7IAJ4_PORTR|nr:hypothetical protein [Portunus trituberculatus]